METYMQMLGRLAKNASREAAKLGTKAKNRGLLAVANELVEERKLILQENAKDIEAAKAKGVKQSLIDRLALRESRIWQKVCVRSQHLMIRSEKCLA